MIWIVKGPWVALKWVWAGIVLFFYALFGLLSVLSWFDSEPTVYNNNPPGGGSKRKEPGKDGASAAEVKPS